MILKGDEAEEFNRKADENYEKYKARQKQNLIDMMDADEKIGLYEKPQPTEDARRLKSIEVKIDTLMYDLMTIIERTESKDCAEPTDQQTTEKIYTIEDIERCVENWGLCKVEREYIEKFLATKQVVKDSLTTQTVEKWEDFELYDVFETAIQESALTVVTKYHNLDEETTELALECVRIFKELKGTTDQNKEDE